MDLSGSWKYIEDVARSRLTNNKTKHHVYDYGEGIEVIGVAGEVIVRRFLGMQEKVHQGFDHGVDIDFFGLKLDVKATILTPSASYRYLQWPNWKKVRAQLIVMTVIDPINKLGTIIGYARREEIIHAPINTSRPTPCHEIPFPELHPAWELVVEGCRRRTNLALEYFPALESDLKKDRNKECVFPTLKRSSV
jgi:hypothetical protein